jgi:hypothetical protein
MTQVIWAEEFGGPTQKKTHYFPKTFLFEHLRSYRWVVTQSFLMEHDAFEQAIKGETTFLASGYDGLRTVEIANTVSLDVSSASGESC